MTNTLWVHGNAAQVQLPTVFASYQYTTGGLYVAANVDEFDWLHIPLLAPMFTNDSQPRLLAVRARLHIQEGGIDQVSVSDGEAIVFQKSVDVIGGNVDFVMPSPHVVETGVALSIHIGHHAHGFEDGRTPMPFTLAAVGADYDFLPVYFKKPGTPPFTPQINPQA